VKKGKWVRLGDELSAALHEYARLHEQKRGGMPEMIESLLPRILVGKAPATVRKYTQTAHYLQKVFAQFAPEQVTAADVVALRRHLIDHATVCNRTISVLRMLFHEALEERLVEANPCAGVPTVKQPKRDRRVEAEEFERIKAQAAPRLAAIMDLCYLTGQRISDVLKIARGDLREEGLYVVQQKTKARVLIRWNADLRLAVDRALALHGDVPGLFLFGKRPPGYSGVWKAYKKAREAAGIPDVVIHDLRAMSGTEAEAQGVDPQKLLGHTDRKMTERYLRDRKITEADGPSFRQSKNDARKAQ
jgi:integrase